MAATATATASPIRRPPRNVRSIFQLTNFWEMDRLWRTASCLQFWFLPDDDLGADRHAFVEVGDVAVDQAEAAGGDGGADRVGPVGAVNAIHRGAEIHRPRAQRVAGTTGHEARQIGLARDHLGRRGPVRPLLLLRDGHEPLPLKTFAADADAVAQRAPVALDQIEMSLGGRNDDGARRLVGAVEHRRLPELRIQLHAVIGDQPWLVADVRLPQLRLALRCRKDQAACGDQRPDQVAEIRHRGALLGGALANWLEPSNLRASLMASLGRRIRYLAGISPIFGCRVRTRL